MSRLLLLLLLLSGFCVPGFAQPSQVAGSDLEPVRNCHAEVMVAPAKSLRIADALLATVDRSSAVEGGALACRGLAQKTLGDGAGMADTLQQLLAFAQRPGLPKHDRRMALHTAQTLLSERGETAQALQILQQLLDEAVADNDVRQQIIVLIGLAATHSQGIGDDAGALHYLDRAIALSNSISRSPHAGDAMLYYNRAFALISLKRYPEARQALDDAERLARRVGGQDLVLHRIASHRAELERLEGKLDLAEAELQRILPWQADKDLQGQIVSVQRLARIASARNDDTAALTLTRQALTLAERAGMIGEIRSTLELLFEIQTRHGDSTAALATGRQLRELDQAHTRGQTLDRLARLQHDTDQRLPADGAAKPLLDHRDRLLRNAAIAGLLLVVALAAGFQFHQQRRHRRLLAVNRHDPPTTLLNRGEAERQLRSLPPAADRSRRIALLRIDIEGLTGVNQRHGQQAGDRLLRVLTQALREISDERDLLARWSGDSLLVARADTSYAAATALAAHLQTRLSSQALAASGDIAPALSVAVGMAPLPLFAGGSTAPGDSLRAIERCLQHVTAGGGNNWAALWGVASATQVPLEALLQAPLRAAAQGQLLLASGGLADWTDAATTERELA